MPKLTRKQKRLLSNISSGKIKLKEFKPPDKNSREKSKFLMILEDGSTEIARRSDIQALIDRGLLKENKEKV